MPNIRATINLKINYIPIVWFSIVLFWAAHTQPGYAHPHDRKDAIVKTVELVSPAVVNISSEYEIRRQVHPFGQFGNSQLDWFFRDFFDRGYEKPYKRNSLGSGVIIDGKRGFILTNAHVITHTGTITVTLKDERSFKAQVVGADPDSDLAVLHIKTSGPLPEASPGNSDDVMIGETVIAIGNPFGFSHTVTTGVISATNRSFKANDRVFRNFIQTDASINPGNSGGPLLNIAGELIGINTAIYANAQGIGFAIPINKADRIVSDLIQYGEVVQAWSGIVVQDVDENLASYLDLADTKGVVVKGVEQNSPAKTAGVKEGDILITLNSKTVASAEEYQTLIQEINAGETMILKGWRQQKAFSISVKTDVYPTDRALELAYRLLGLQVDNITGRSTYHQRVPVKGVVITNLHNQSYLARIGAEPGDVIRQINGLSIDNLDDFKKAVIKFRLKSSLVVLLQRGGNGYYITVEI
jgi:serine protease Do